MKNMRITVAGARVGDVALREKLAALAPEIEQIKKARSLGYKTEYASINLPADEELQQKIAALVAKKQQFEPELVVVVGIGGSSLGAKAVYEVVLGRLHHLSAPACQLLFAESVESDHLFAIMQAMIATFKRGGTVLLNVISKSGATTETIANFELLLGLMQEYRPHDVQQLVVVTTDEGSALWEFARARQFDLLAIPAQVGGRYSVFSAVGLFPLACAGIDVAALCAGARDMVEQCTQQENNPAALTAAVAALQYQQGLHVHDLFLFSSDCAAVGAWYRQLVGESLGKERDRAGLVVEVGVTPTISLGSDDLHSVGQLYFGGPRDKAVTLLSFDAMRHRLVLPQQQEFDALVPKIQGKSLHVIMQAIVRGVQVAYAQAQRPYVMIELADKSAYSIGQFLQYKMIEIMYFGFLLNVNPFDQPQVELYKKETREILAHE